LARAIQPDWYTPNIDVWSQTLAEQINAQPAPLVIIAHSFGCLATVHAAERVQHRVCAALLVAPVDPNLFGIAHRLNLTALPFASIVVGSRNDPWMAFDWAQWWAKCWHSKFIDLGHAGHINSKSKLGDWTAGWMLAQSLAVNRISK
jgi:predicted alpha/beta hydrolase family esterase